MEINCGVTYCLFETLEKIISEEKLNHDFFIVLCQKPEAFVQVLGLILNGNIYLIKGNSSHRVFKLHLSKYFQNSSSIAEH